MSETNNPPVEQLPVTETPETEDAAIAEAFSRYAGHGKKKKKGPRVLPGESISHLNLVPMMDMMTVLLVFLVKNFMTDPQSIQVNDSLRPPASTATVDMAPATTITITATDILVESKAVVKLSDITVSGSKDVAIPKLRDELQAQVSQREALFQRGGPPFDGKLLLVAHQTTPYSLITSVLYTAGEAKFSSYRLVVMKKAEKAGI